jgi:5-(carboxyamino)imidazole ribonucleotide synthase
LSGLPLGRTDSTGYSASLNILGDISADGEADEATLRQRVVQIPFAHLHLYGKKWVKPHRKMGHVTIAAKTAKELHAYVSKIPIEALRILSLPSKP